MDMPFDSLGDRPIAAPGLTALFAGPPATGFTIAPLDWRGLVARLGAAHALRRVLVGATQQRRAASGSFAPALARQVAAFRAGSSPQTPANSCRDINQTAKADGKPPGSIGENSKGKDPTAVRGQS